MALSIDLAGQRAFITGVTSGIGAGIARAFAEAGCDIAGCGLEASDSEGAQAFIASVHQYKRAAHYASVDLSDPVAPATWVQQAAHAIGGIDFLVSNAGRNLFKGAAECSEADWNECMNLDLAAHWRLSQAARALLDPDRKLVILIIASNHAYRTIPGCFPYNVAKAGLVALIQSLAIEWGPAIRAVGIAPGFIDTAGNDTWFHSFPDPSAERRRTEQLHPVGRLGSVEEIGGLCAFLCSPYAGFISGTTLLVDGGRSALMQDT
jgi:NAD(P)-dependent dehydrogenase (short-subunit alcohol dehydrogenase family)